MGQRLSFGSPRVLAFNEIHKRTSSRIASSSLKKLGAKRHFALRGTSRDFAATIAAMFEQELWRSAIWC
jgi:hypothetical protein